MLDILFWAVWIGERGRVSVIILRKVGDGLFGEFVEVCYNSKISSIK
jgi:hypothetical protein